MKQTKRKRKQASEQTRENLTDFLLMLRWVNTMGLVACGKEAWETQAAAALLLASHFGIEDRARLAAAVTSGELVRDAFTPTILEAVQADERALQALAGLKPRAA